MSPTRSAEFRVGGIDRSVCSVVALVCPAASRAALPVTREDAMTTRKGTVSAAREAAVTIGQDSGHAWETGTARGGDTAAPGGAEPRGRGLAERAARAGGPAAGSRRRRGVTLVLLGSIVVSFLAASAAPTPMYALYAKQWGFSALATTVVFGVYALAVLAGLLTFGRVSDYIGRRPVLLAGLA